MSASTAPSVPARSVACGARLARVREAAGRGTPSPLPRAAGAGGARGDRARAAGARRARAPSRSTCSATRRSSAISAACRSRASRSPARCSSEIVGLCTFLEYGTTAKAARLYGAGPGARGARRRRAGDLAGARAGNASARVVLELAAGPALRLIAGSGRQRVAARGADVVPHRGARGAVHARDRRGAGLAARVPGHAHGLRVLVASNLASVALSLTLIRGFGLGIEGSAIANVVSQVAAAAVFVVLLVRRTPSLAPVLGAHAAAVARRARSRPALARVHGRVPARGGRRGAHGRRAGGRAHDRLPALDLRRARARLGRDRGAGADRPAAGRRRRRRGGDARAAAARRRARLRHRGRRALRRRPSRHPGAVHLGCRGAPAGGRALALARRDDARGRRRCSRSTASSSAPATSPSCAA